MATHDYVIDNQSSATARADINNVLQAILTNNSSSTAPTTTAGNMIWYDTSSNQLKIRDEADSGWIVIAYLDQTNDRMEVRSDVIQAASAGGIDVKNSSGTTIIDLQVASQATAETGTNNTELMTPLRTKQAIDINAQSTAYEAVGTYVFGFLDQEYPDTAAGGTVAGSALRPAGFNHNQTTASSGYVTLGGHNIKTNLSDPLPGTWRCMGVAVPNVSTDANTTLWVRIS